METLFENRYTRTDDIVREYMRPTQLLNPISLLLYLTIFYFIFRAFLLWYDSGALDVLSLLCSAVVLVMYFALYLARERSALKQNRLKRLKMHYTATDTHLTVTSGDFSAQISYHDVRSIRRTRNLIILYTRRRVGWIFPVDSFTKGAAEDFVYYLRAKGLRVR